MQAHCDHYVVSLVSLRLAADRQRASAEERRILRPPLISRGGLVVDFPTHPFFPLSSEGLNTLVQMCFPKVLQYHAGTKLAPVVQVRLSAPAKDSWHW